MTPLGMVGNRQPQSGCEGAVLVDPLIKKKGARNCQSPVWLKEELKIIRKAWSVDEAVIMHDLGMTPETPYRSFDAIKKCWMREHPKLGRTDLRMKSELDKLAEVV